MSNAREWTRRSVLEAIAALGAVAILRPLAGTWLTSAAKYPELEPRLLFREVRSAAILGRAYLQLYPEERSVARLQELIWSQCTNEEIASAGSGRGALQAVLSARLRCDFERAQTVLIDGWVLARTEARLYALAALS